MRNGVAIQTSNCDWDNVQNIVDIKMRSFYYRACGKQYFREVNGKCQLIHPGF